ncbi:MAG: hypothetical protein R3A51_06140 [Nannocystaceae bacterium]
MSTRGTLSVPRAAAAIAWAPPIANTRSTPARAAAHSTTSLGRGVNSSTSGTPATLAGIAVISTEDG